MMIENDLPQTTLFMLMSVDGKISTGASDERDFDKDLPNIAELANGLQQYYALEQETDLFSFNTGKVMAKVGWNDKKNKIDRLPVTFILVDNKPHLTSLGIANLVQRTEKLYIVTTNKAHPALRLSDASLEVIQFDEKIDFVSLFQTLKTKGTDKLTIQSGGEMNAILLRAGLINFISIVVAPVLVGGRQTPTLIDGHSLNSIEDLQKLRLLKLTEIKQLENSYVNFKYEVNEKQ